MSPPWRQVIALVVLCCVFHGLEAVSGHRQPLRHAILNHGCHRRFLEDHVPDRIHRRSRNPLTRGLQNQQSAGKRRSTNIVLCYWNSKSNVDNLPVDLCSHVVYSQLDASINTRSNASLEVLRKRSPGLIILLGVGSWIQGGDRYQKMLRSRRRRKDLVSDVVRRVRSGNLDGVSLDFWRLETMDEPHFVKAIQEMRESFENERKKAILSVTVPAARPDLLDDDAILDLAPMVDYFTVMPHDKKDGRPSSTSLHREAFAAADVLVERGVREENILLGIPFFGRRHVLNGTAGRGLASHSVARAGPSAKGHDLLTYFEICSKLKTDWTRLWDEQKLRPLAYGEDQWVSYEDEQSVRCKVKHVRLRRYGGVAVWTADMDDNVGSCGRKSHLLKTIQEELNGMVFGATATRTWPRNPTTVTVNAETVRNFAEKSTVKKNDTTASTETSVGTATWELIAEASTISSTAVRDVTLRQEPRVSTVYRTLQPPVTGPTAASLTAAEATTLSASTVGRTSTWSAPDGEEGRPDDPGVLIPSSKACENSTETLVPHENDCSLFYYCSDGLAYLHRCPSKSIFDVRQRVCDWPESVRRPECEGATSK